MSHIHANSQDDSDLSGSSNQPPSKHKTLLIQGLTASGGRFRPSDWVERICSLTAGFRAGRLHYSELLYPVLVNGVKCVHVDGRLAQQQPEIHNQVMYFAESNQLNIIERL
jgi:hypothetical protein